MSKYYIEPVGTIANEVCLQLIRDANIDACKGKKDINGEPHDVYEVSESNHTNIRKRLAASSDNFQVIFWVDTGTEVLKQLLKPKAIRI